MKTRRQQQMKKRTTNVKQRKEKMKKSAGSEMLKSDSTYFSRSYYGLPEGPLPITTTAVDYASGATLVSFLNTVPWISKFPTGISELIASCLGAHVYALEITLHDTPLMYMGDTDYVPRSTEYHANIYALDLATLVWHTIYHTRLCSGELRIVTGLCSQGSTFSAIDSNLCEEYIFDSYTHLWHSRSALCPRSFSDAVEVVSFRDSSSVAMVSSTCLTYVVDEEDDEKEEAIVRSWNDVTFKAQEKPDAQDAQETKIQSHTFKDETLDKLCNVFLMISMCAVRCDTKVMVWLQENKTVALTQKETVQNQTHGYQFDSVTLVTTPLGEIKWLPTGTPITVLKMVAYPTKKCVLALLPTSGVFWRYTAEDKVWVRAVDIPDLSSLSLQCDVNQHTGHGTLVLLSDESTLLYIRRSTVFMFNHNHPHRKAWTKAYDTHTLPRNNNLITFSATNSSTIHIAAQIKRARGPLPVIDSIERPQRSRKFLERIIN